DPLAFVGPHDRTPVRLRLQHHICHATGAFSLAINLRHAPMDFGGGTIPLDRGQTANNLRHFSKERIGSQGHAPGEHRNGNIRGIPIEFYTAIGKTDQVGPRLQPQAIKHGPGLLLGRYAGVRGIEHRLKVIKRGYTCSDAERSSGPIQLYETIKSNLRGRRTHQIAFGMFILINGTMSSSTDIPPCATIWSPFGTKAPRVPAYSGKKSGGRPGLSNRKASMSAGTDDAKVSLR